MFSNKKIKLEIWGKEKEIEIVYDCYKGEEISKEQYKSLNNFLSHIELIEKAKKNVVKYCKKDVDNDLKNDKKDNIFSYIMPESLFIKRDKKDCRIALMCKYKYDMEHGIAIVFLPTGKIEVASQDIIL